MRPAATALAVAAMALVSHSVPALASWLSSSTTTATFSTVALEPATALTVAPFCHARRSPAADLVWEAPATLPPGYRVERHRDGVLEHVAELGGAVTAYRDIELETNATYTWHVLSVAASWRSAAVTVDATTPHPCNPNQVTPGP